MSHSLLTAGHTTYIKIVGVALAFAIMIVVFGINAKSTNDATPHIQSDGIVVRAEKIVIQNGRL